MDRDRYNAAERGTIDDVIMPHAKRLRIADKFTQSAQRKIARARHAEEQACRDAGQEARQFSGVDGIIFYSASIAIRCFFRSS